MASAAQTNAPLLVLYEDYALARIEHSTVGDFSTWLDKDYTPNYIGAFC